MELTTLELTNSIENFRERGLSLVENTRTAGVEFIDRTQRVTVEWLAESERKLLSGVLEAIRELEARIQRRVELLDASVVEAPARGGDAGAPLEGYDEYTAKEIIAELAALSADSAKAVLEYERANKARATVIRAAEQRLVA